MTVKIDVAFVSLVLMSINNFGKFNADGSIKSARGNAFGGQWCSAFGNTGQAV